MNGLGNPKSHPICPPDFLLFCFACAAQKRKETRLSKNPQKKKTQRQVKNEHCTCIPNPQNSKNTKMTTRNSQITAKSMEIYENTKKANKS